MYTGSRAAMINAALSSKLSETLQRVLELRDSGELKRLTTEKVRRKLESEQTDGQKDFSAITEECIASKRRAASTVASMRLTAKHVRACGGGPVFLEGIDRKFLTALEDHIGGKTNTIAVHMRNIRTVFNFAIEEGYTERYPFRKYKIKTEETADRSLTAEELRLLFDYPVDPWQREYLDIFKLIFFLCGINMADLAKMPKPKGDRIEFNRTKTGVHCSIKIQPEAREIIERYAGKDRMLSILDRYADHKDYLRHLNHALGKIGTTFKAGCPRSGNPLFPDITSYWARVSWATIAGELDVPERTIGAALGHSKSKSVTSIYIRTDMRKKVDDANRKVIDYVLHGAGQETNK
ncbi:MAG: site-specific integrase [Bacteroidales bacterium]|nr:site-specific integrase [Bacteroidales bacterium]